MRLVKLFLAGTAVLNTGAALAADQLKFGKPPQWVVEQSIATSDKKPIQGPGAILLMDQQVRFEHDRTVTYAEMAFKIQTAEGLSAGNLSIPWDPATDSVTVNKLQIRRGDKVIDVLAAGQTFTTMRRESNLELAMLDGMLTANIQPEGLQVGDIIDLATTIEHVDPLFDGHSELDFAPWGSAQIVLAHASLNWPSGMDLTVRKTGDLPHERQTSSDGRKTYELVMHDVEPTVPPKDAPLRFRVARLGEATNFHSWAEVAKLFIPLYEAASKIPSSGPLSDEVDKIRSASADPQTRAELALRLVQERTRYVALSMGRGGYVPANADLTWSRRFGDCKGKTALLLGILHELGIRAHPILVNTAAGDIIGARLPMARLFDHVLVQAEIGSKSYYLDGTRTGDLSLDAIEVPDFSWGLPLVPDAKLVSLIPPTLQLPAADAKVTIDASNGLRAPAAVSIDEVMRGDEALAFHQGLSSLAEAQQTEFFDRFWKGSYDFVTPGTTKVEFDPVKKVLTLSMKGSGKLDWNSGWFRIPDSTVGFTPDFDRAPGPFHDAPVAVSYPSFTHNLTTVRMPAGFFGSRPMGSDPDVNETLAGVEYRMKISKSSSAAADTLVVERSERSLAPEIPYASALAAASRLRQLADQDVAVPMSRSYRPTSADLAAWLAEKPASADAFVDRGNALMNAHRYDEAIADFSQALTQDPKNITGLADRGLAYVWTGKTALAQKDFATATQLAPDNATLLRGRALLAEKQGNCVDAIGFYSKSLVTDPDSAFARGRRGLCEASLSRNDEALADTAAALKTDPSWMDLRVARANIFYRTGKIDDVANEAKLLTAENPHSSFSFVAAGRIYGKLNRHQDATKAFDAALEIKPEAFIYINRAQARLWSDKSGRLADLDAALKLEPNNPDALAEKAEELAVDGDYKQATQLYDLVIKAVPDERYYKVRKAVLLFKAGDVETARKLLADLRAGAKSANDFNSLCWAKATAGIMLDDALNECREALKREPDTGSYLDSLALVELRLGSVDAAIADYTRAISKNSMASYMGRAIAYSRKGDKERSTADATQALRVDPDAQTRFAEYGLKLN